MRQRLRKAIPSMFHRRLLLLMVMFAGVLMLLGVQTARLTLGASHEARRAAAERALSETELVPTARGAILDRRGRILAQDRAGYALAVRYDLISGSWVNDRASKLARRANRLAWAEMSDDSREAAIAKVREAEQRKVQEFWAVLGGVTQIPGDELERRRMAVIARVGKLQTHLWSIWRDRQSERTGQTVSWAQVSRPIASQVQSHTLVRGLDPATVSTVRRFIAEAKAQSGEDASLAPWTRVSVRPVSERDYPLETLTVRLPVERFPAPLREAMAFTQETLEVQVEGVGLHLIGRMRPAYAQDLSARPMRTPSGAIDLGGYLDGDRVGATGIEASMESRLRGARGQRTIYYDGSEREDVIETVPGRPVRLTVDLALQAQVQAVMSPEVGLMQTQSWHGRDDVEAHLGEKLNGSAVVMDITSGEILAAVSVPTAPLRLMRRDMDTLAQDVVDLPLLNRAVARAYQPGSSLKPLVVAAAVSDGKLGRHETIDLSRGYLWEGKPNVYQDWLWKRYQRSFGTIDASTALKVSANTFMGYLVGRIGPEAFVGWYQRFGMGAPVGTGLSEEIGGDLPDPNGKVAYADACFMGIGQGPVRWTPIQAVHAMSTLARGGVALPPTLVMDADRLEPRARGETLPLTRTAVDLALEGMHRSANEGRTGDGQPAGTTHQFAPNENIWTAPNVKVWAKSGTAQAVPLREPIDDDGDGFPDRFGGVLKSGDHAWVIAFVAGDGAREPEYAIAVVVEYAGSGGKVAGPIVNQIVYALKDHGYLP